MKNVCVELKLKVEQLKPGHSRPAGYAHAHTCVDAVTLKHICT